jgi:hypothetical protein
LFRLFFDQPWDPIGASTQVFISFLFRYGPLLLAAVAGNGVGDGGWQVMAASPVSTPLNIVLPGVSGPPEGWTQNWLTAVSGKPAHFAVSGSNITLMPYMLVEDEHFTAFPLVRNA